MLGCPEFLPRRAHRNEQHVRTRSLDLTDDGVLLGLVEVTMMETYNLDLGVLMTKTGQCTLEDGLGRAEDEDSIAVRSRGGQQLVHQIDARNAHGKWFAQ